MGRASPLPPKASSRRLSTSGIIKAFARGQFLDEWAGAFCQPALVHLPQARTDIVIDQAAHPAQLAHRVKVAHQRHVGIGCRPVFLVERLRRGEIGDIDANEGGLQTAAIGADAQVAASRRALARTALAREEIILNVQALRRENLHFAQEKRLHLLAGAPDGGGSGDHFGAHALAIHLPGAEVIDTRFVQPDQRAERPGDQVQLVLDNQVWRAQGLVWVRHGARKAAVRGV